MNNSNQLVDVITSILGDKANSNTLAIKVAQEIVEHDFLIGQKLAEMIFSPNANDHSDAETLNYFKTEHAKYQNAVENEIEVSKSLSYLEHI